MFSLSKPKSFLGADSQEIKYDKHFELMCLMVSKDLKIDAKKLTVLSFYSAISAIKKQNDQKAKEFSRIKRK